MNRQPQTRPPKPSEPFHRAHRNIFVGAFILVALLLVAAALVYSLGRTAFVKRYALHVIYDNSYGLSSSSAVTVSGIKIGGVSKVALLGDGRVAVTLEILREHAQLVSKNSKALVKQKGMVVGDWEIEIVRSDSPAPPAQEGDTLEAAIPLKLDKVIEQVLVMVTTVDKILQGINNGQGIVGRALKSDALADKVERILDDVHRIAVRAERTIRLADSAIIALGALGPQYSGLSDTLQNMIAGTLQGLDPILGDAKVLLGTLNDVSGDLKPILGQVQKDLEELNTILRALQEHPLLKGSVKKAREKESGAK